jgi:hypothetical protein
MRTIHILIVVASSLAACGGGESSSESGVCAAMCEQEKRCDGTTTCQPCELDESLLQTDAREALTGCYQTLACDESDDQCFFAAIDASDTRAVDTQFTELCLGAVETCGITDDICGLSKLYEAEHVEAAIACFDGTCDLEDCLENAFGFE